MRAKSRAPDQLRPIRITREYTKHAEGSVLVEFGETKVLCTASVCDGAPRFLKGKTQGWLTAEYSMLPRATHQRTEREATKGRQQGRTLEIQRLIGRSLRAALDLSKLGDYTITLDCDVLQADGGTRTASITGAYVALVDALRTMQRKKKLQADPLLHMVASVSVGVVRGTPMLDLDYEEDSKADSDMNFVMTDHGGIIELQGTAEGNPFTIDEFQHVFELANSGIQQLFEIQKQALAQ